MLKLNKKSLLKGWRKMSTNIKSMKPRVADRYKELDVRPMSVKYASKALSYIDLVFIFGFSGFTLYKLYEGYSNNRGQNCFCLFGSISFLFINCLFNFRCCAFETCKNLQGGVS